jgi:hypothetical protein
VCALYWRIFKSRVVLLDELEIFYSYRVLSTQLRLLKQPYIAGLTGLSTPYFLYEIPSVEPGIIPKEPKAFCGSDGEKRHCHF